MGLVISRSNFLAVSFCARLGEGEPGEISARENTRGIALEEAARLRLVPSLFRAVLNFALAPATAKVRIKSPGIMRRVRAIGQVWI